MEPREPSCCVEVVRGGRSSFRYLGLSVANASAAASDVAATSCASRVCVSDAVTGAPLLSLPGPPRAGDLRLLREVVARAVALHAGGGPPRAFTAESFRRAVRERFEVVAVPHGPWTDRLLGSLAFVTRHRNGALWLYAPEGSCGGE